MLEEGKRRMKYKTVVVDPPWPVQHYAYPKDLLFNHGLTINLPYKDMTEDELIGFQIDDFAEKECLLFLWFTTGKLKSGRLCIELALDMIKEWGLCYRAMLFWNKGSGITKPFLPYQATVEPILFCTRGISKVPPFGKYKDLFSAPRGKHSSKPDRFYQMLRAWTPKPRIDLFGRNAHEGFDGWGDEYVGEGPLAEYLK